MLTNFFLLLPTIQALIWGNHFVEQNPRDPEFMRKAWSGVAEINAERHINHPWKYEHSRQPQAGRWHLIPVELMSVRTEIRKDGVYYQFDAICRESTCPRHKVAPAFVNKELCTERSSGDSFLIRLVLVEMPKNRTRYFVEDKQYLGFYQHC